MDQTITIQLRYFAIIRETLGRAEETRVVPTGTTAEGMFDLLAAENPGIARMKQTTMVMVNQAYVERGSPLRDGDEVALIPPVSGGGGAAERRFRVTTDPLDAREVEAQVAEPGAGAVVTFTGSVRDHARGRVVMALEYEAYAPAAEALLTQIGDEIAALWGIERVAIAHRTGRLAVGEASGGIAVASAHRGEAFAACQSAIERLKEIVPIWKKEWYGDGAVWIGSEAEYQQGVAGSSQIDRD